MRLGTILPTRESLAAGDRHADKMNAKQEQIGRTLTGTVRRVVGGEVRYYRGAALYAVVTLSLSVRWFEVRTDGDWPVSTA